MDGTPSAYGAGFRSALIRALLRIAMLAGLILGAWLLGTATASAQEISGADPSAAVADDTAASLPAIGAAVQDALPPALSDTVSGTALPQLAVPQIALPQVTVPQIAVPRVTVPRVTVPQVTVPQVSDPEPRLGAVLTPALGPAVDAVQPAPATAPEQPAAAPSAAKVTAEARTQPVATPRSLADTAQVSPASGRSAPETAAAQVGRQAGPSPGTDHPALPATDGTAPACPSGGVGGSGATTHSAQSVTLDDQRDAADLATAQRPWRSYADGIQRRSAERPSTSPD
ncbi:MAG TPA: hypothetical protein VGI84_08660 [Pseudonocardiaceae bacterium]